MSTDNQHVVKAQIHQSQARVLNRPLYSLKPWRPAFNASKGDGKGISTSVPDHVKIASEMILQIDPQEGAEFLKLARNFNAPLVLITERGERIDATIQGMSYSNPVEITVDPK
jgi:hypothetical protein